MKKIMLSVLFLVSILVISGCNVQESPIKKEEYVKTGQDCSNMMDIAAKCPQIMGAQNELELQKTLEECGIESKRFSIFDLMNCICCVGSGNPYCCINCGKAILS